MKHGIRALSIGLTAGVMFGLSTLNSSACATCFGQTDSPLGRGLNWGIFALLAVVGCVLAAICSFFVFIARRSAKLEAEAQPTSPTATAPSSSPQPV